MDSVQVQTQLVSGVMSLVGLLLLVVIFALLIFAASKLSGRTLAMILGGGCLFLLLSFFFLGVSRPVVRLGEEVSVGELKIETADGVPVRSTQVTSKSTSELWDKLTEPRIQLDEVEEEAQSDEQKETETKEPATPEWINWTSKRVGNINRQVLVSERFVTEDECYQQLEQRFQAVVQVRLQQLLAGLPGSPYAIPAPGELGIGLHYIMSNICIKAFPETVDTSVGEMKRVHVLMEFDATVDDQLRNSWQRYERLSRLETVGGVAGLALGGLALVFGLLKFDTWTRGYYTKRLLIGVPAAIIVVVLFFIS